MNFMKLSFQFVAADHVLFGFQVNFVIVVLAAKFFVVRTDITSRQFCFVLVKRLLLPLWFSIYVKKKLNKIKITIQVKRKIHVNNVLKSQFAKKANFTYET